MTRQEIKNEYDRMIEKQENHIIDLIQRRDKMIHQAAIDAMNDMIREARKFKGILIGKRIAV